MPEYTSAIGPSLTLQVPLKSSPSTSVTVAPGKQPATDSMSLKAAQVSADGGRDGERVVQVHACDHAPAAASTARRVSTVARCLR